MDNLQTVLLALLQGLVERVGEILSGIRQGAVKVEKHRVRTSIPAHSGRPHATM